MTRLYLSIMVLSCAPCVSLAQDPPATNLVPIPQTESSENGTESLVRSLLIKSLPSEYDNAKDWGKTKPRWDGLHVSLDGLRLDTKRKWKDVNHGTWTRYRAWLINPSQELQIYFVNMRPLETGGVTFDLIADLRFGASGRLSQWNWGVQLYSFSAEAEGKIRLQMTCELQLKLDASKLPPDVLLSPRVTKAHVELHQFNLNRISDADGPLVRKLGDNLHADIQRELDERRTKIVEKLNRSLEKNQHHLRLSVHDLIASGWGKWMPMSATAANID